MTDGMPQVARDGLHSHLWFAAKDDTDDPAVRRELLAAVAAMEREPVNEVEACGVRYRVVRGDEFARCDDDGLEPPRPTDPEPAQRSWDRRAKDTTSPDVGFVLDPARPDGLAAGALQLGLRGFAYTGALFPSDVRADSEMAVATHPDPVLLPTGFGVVERGRHGCQPCGALMATPLYGGMSEIWAMLYQYDDAKKTRYARRRGVQGTRPRRRVPPRRPPVPDLPRRTHAAHGPRRTGVPAPVGHRRVRAHEDAPDDGRGRHDPLRNGLVSPVGCPAARYGPLSAGEVLDVEAAGMSNPGERTSGTPASACR